MSVTTHDPGQPDWELSKENFQPLKAGRKPEALRDTPADSQTQENQRRWVVNETGWQEVHSIECTPTSSLT
jgi:hypothetical protein